MHERARVHTPTGTSSLCSTPVERLEVVSYGLVMYFVLLKYLFFCFAALSFIALPVIAFSFSGSPHTLHRLIPPSHRLSAHRRAEPTRR